MKIISWNVNGIRAWSKKENTFDWVFKQNADLICLQETKARPEQLSDELLEPEGYYSYFEYSKVKKGYSGVAIYTKHEPDRVEEGLGIKELDQEGRFLALFYDKLVVINCYFPNGGQGGDMFEFKLRYFDAFLEYVLKLKKRNYKIIFVGDVNVAHQEIDIARPKENKNSIGFLPVEREWISKVIKNGFVDTWRFQNPETVKYSWWDMKTRARDRDVGWRIDYIFTSENMKKDIKKTSIHNNIFGSDHCPISLELA
jgi:exodeoxyribonuclease III